MQKDELKIEEEKEEKTRDRSKVRKHDKRTRCDLHSSQEDRCALRVRQCRRQNPAKEAGLRTYCMMFVSPVCKMGLKTNRTLVSSFV